MDKHQRATAVPYSSIVGGSVLMHLPSGEVECQLALLGVGANAGQDHREMTERLSKEVATALNQHDHLIHLLEVVRDNEVDRIGDGENRTMSNITLSQIKRALEEAGR